MQTLSRVETVVPLSLAQQRLWFIDQLVANRAVSHRPLALRLRGKLDEMALEQSLNEIVRRHETLRTSFEVREQRPVQVTGPFVPFSLLRQDLRSSPHPQATLQQMINQEVQRPFDLTQPPLFHTLLFQVGNEEYVLLLVFHAIVADERSLRVCFQELLDIYQAFIMAMPSLLPEPLSVRYEDFVVQQREEMQTLASQVAYWKQQLEGLPPVVQLPTDRPRLAMPTFQCGSASLLLAPELTEQLRTLSQQMGVSVFTTLLAVVNTLVFRYGGQDDIASGIPVEQRVCIGQNELIGACSNTLVIRTQLSGELSFQDLLHRVHAIMAAAYTHQDMPFERLLETLHIGQELSYHPLFQIMVSWQEVPLERVELPDLSVQPMYIPRPATLVDIALTCAETVDGLRIDLEYSADLFDAATMARFVGHLRTLLEGVVAHPEQAIARLPLLTVAEREQLLNEWNATASAYPRDLCVYQLFEEQAQYTPNDVAVVFEDERLTYQELNLRANQLAHYLRALGVGPEILVGICVERSPEMLIGLLGILKAGGAYVPLDPTYPVERLAFMLENSQAPVLVTQQHLVAGLPVSALRVVCLDADAARLEQQRENNLLPFSKPEHLAYVIYTSGSTGRPKGVQVLQGALVNYLTSMLPQPGLEATDVLLAVTTLSFDIAGLELFLPLILGARVVLVSRDVAANGELLAEALEQFQVTAMQATPITWRILLASGWQGTPGLKVISGGEALPPDLAQQLLAKSASLWNLYGPTETTIYSSSCQILPEDHLITIGRPIGNTQMYVLDSYLQPVPVGVAGELYIGGDGLARGYLKRPELTAERFIPHPFSQEPGARIYNAGDLVRYRPNGEIEIIGRSDHQVKIRGFRIELGEIEAVLSQHPCVQQCVVVVREDTPGNKRLIAYIATGEQTNAALVSELRNHVRESLPDYMLPSAFVLLKALPRTPNGKIDRKALPTPDATNSMREGAVTLPDTPTEMHLIEIIAPLLHLETIGIDENFFWLGANSLTSVQIVARIKDHFGLAIPLRTLFNAPTVRQLAVEIDRRWFGDHELVSENGLRILALQNEGDRRPFFFLHGQWTGDAFYCYPLARNLGADQLFYLLEPYPLVEQPIPPRLVDVAAAHLKLLRTVQPEGPYLLGGWCNGALIVYEMARQLCAEGQQVDLLVLMEPMSLVYVPHLRLLRGIFTTLGKLFRLREDKQFALYLQVKQGLKHAYRTLRYAWYRKSPELRVPTAKALRKDYVTIFDWMAMGYKPASQYPGKITFFWSSAQTFRYGWREVEAGRNIELHYVPGDHITCRTDHLPALTECLRESVEKALYNL